MFGSSSTTSSRASVCAAASVIDVFMRTIFVRLAVETLNVYSETSVLTPSVRQLTSRISTSPAAVPPSQSAQASGRAGEQGALRPQTRRGPGEGTATGNPPGTGVPMRPGGRALPGARLLGHGFLGGARRPVGEPVGD